MPRLHRFSAVYSGMVQEDQPLDDEGLDHLGDTRGNNTCQHFFSRENIDDIRRTTSSAPVQ